MKLLIHILLLFPVLGISQINFIERYGGSGNDYGKSIVSTFDTSYVIVGATESYGNGNTDMYLFKIDSLGAFQWSTTFGGSNMDWGMDIVELYDHDLMMCGYTNSNGFDYDAYVVKTDSAGNLEWETTVGGDDWDFVYGMTKTKDTTVVLAGETYSYGAGQKDAYAICLNHDGDTLWTKTFGGTNDDKFMNVIENVDGDLLFVGSTSSNSVGGDLNLWVVKTDSAGNTIWEYEDGDVFEDEGYSILELNNGNYYITGYNTTSIAGNLKDAWFKTIDPSGANVYDQKIIANPGDEMAMYATQLYDESEVFMLISTQAIGSGGWDMSMTNISNGGWYVGGTTLGVGSSYHDFGEKADTTFDHSYIVVGTTDYTANGLNAVLVVKMDSLFSTPPFTWGDNLDITDVEEPTLLSELTTYPNPCENELNISPTEELMNREYYIQDALGAIIYTGRLTDWRIDTSNIPKGTYFLSFPNLSKSALPFIKL